MRQRGRIDRAPREQPVREPAERDAQRNRDDRRRPAAHEHAREPGDAGQPERADHREPHGVERDGHRRAGDLHGHGGKLVPRGRVVGDARVGRLDERAERERRCRESIEDRGRRRQVEDVVVGLRDPIRIRHPPEGDDRGGDDRQHPRGHEPPGRATHGVLEPRHGATEPKRDREPERRHRQRLPGVERQARGAEDRRGDAGDADAHRAGERDPREQAEPQRRGDDEPGADGEHHRRHDDGNRVGPGHRRVSRSAGQSSDPPNSLRHIDSAEPIAMCMSRYWYVPRRPPKCTSFSPFASSR